MFVSLVTSRRSSVIFGSGDWSFRFLWYNLAASTMCTASSYLGFLITLDLSIYGSSTHISTTEIRKIIIIGNISHLISCWKTTIIKERCRYGDVNPCASVQNKYKHRLLSVRWLTSNSRPPTLTKTTLYYPCGSYIYIIPTVFLHYS